MQFLTLLTVFDLTYLWLPIYTDLFTHLNSLTREHLRIYIYMHIYTAAEHCEQPERIPDPCIQHPLSRRHVLVGAVLKTLQAELARTLFKA